jgi:signal peptidase I
MRRALGIAVSVCAMLAICLAVALLLLPPIFHLQRYVITGASMEPAIHRGSIVFDRVVPSSSLRVGDIVTFVPPGYPTLVTHRIVSKTTVAGKQVFLTRGDANQSRDPWQITFTQGRQARFSFAIPYVGYLLAALSIRSLRLLFLAAPAFLIGISFLVSVARDVVAERRQTTAGIARGG